MLHTILNKEAEKSREEPCLNKVIGRGLNAEHHQQCCGTDVSKKERGLDPEWIEANCRSVDIKEATELLRYPARSATVYTQVDSEIVSSPRK